jgi:hypothetical protein
VIAEDAGYGTVLRRFVYGPGLDEPLVWYEGSDLSDRHWLHADERGSIVAVSNDSGAVTAINRYDEYGVPQGTLAGPFGYSGQQWIPFTDPSGLECRDIDTWMAHVVRQRWWPDRTGPPKITDKWIVTRTICDSPLTSSVPSGPGDGGGDGEGILVVGQSWTKPPRRVCGPSAPNSAFFFEGRTQVGAFIGMPIGLRHGLSHVRVVAAAPPSLVVGERDLYSGGLGSILIRFASSNRIPIHSLGTHTIVTSRPGSFAAMLGGDPAVVTLSVPGGALYAWVIPQNNTAPGTRVSIYGC